MISKYARERAATLLRRLAFRANRAARQRDPGCIHDLRVSIRRFQQCLLVFERFFPRGESKKIHRRLHKIMTLTGEIRNRDIAHQLLKTSGVAPDSAVYDRLRQESREYYNELSSRLRRWGTRDISRKWASRLRL